jgi:thioredoxin-like negative regulator of GroEL
MGGATSGLGVWRLLSPFALARRRGQIHRKGSIPVQHTCERTKAGVEERVCLPRLVFFTAPTSGHCRKVDGWIAQVLQHRRNHLKVKLVTVDAEARPDLLERFRVEQLPTLVVVEDRIAKARLECPRGTREIASMLAPWLL